MKAALAGPLPEDAWTGRTGFVHRAVMEDFPDLSGHQVYACGVPIMVESAKRDFVAQCGLPEDDFIADLVVATNAGQIKTAPSEIISGLLHGDKAAQATEKFKSFLQLMKWCSKVTKLAVRTNLTGSVEFTDRAATNYPARFYRAVAP